MPSSQGHTALNSVSTSQDDFREQIKFRNLSSHSKPIQRAHYDMNYGLNGSISVYGGICGDYGIS